MTDDFSLASPAGHFIMGDGSGPDGLATKDGATALSRAASVDTATTQLDTPSRTINLIIEYIRKLLIHGARATLRWAKTKADRRSQWIRGLLDRRGWNRTAVAVANKNARIVWALLSRGGV